MANELLHGGHLLKVKIKEMKDMRQDVRTPCRSIKGKRMKGKGWGGKQRGVREHEAI